MGLIRVLFLFLALLESFKGLSVNAYSDQSCPMSHELEEECSVYAHQVTKPMLRYFEQVTQKIDKHSAEIESKNEQIRHLEENEIRLQNELDIKHEQIRQQGENIMKLQMENVNYKLKETGVLEDLKQKMEQLPNNLCEYQNNELKEFKGKEIELNKELTNKNEQIKQLEENMTKLQIEISTYKSKVDSMAVVQKELNSEKEKITALETKISSNAEKLLTCESELVAKDIKIIQLETEVKESANIMLQDIPKYNTKTCIPGDSGVHTVRLSNCYTFKVLCNSGILDPGWTVIHQRFNGGVDFYRNWTEYRNGFGDFWDGEFFLGLEKIHRLTTEVPHELYIHMERFDLSTFYAAYDEFVISGEDDKYRLSKLGEFSSPTSDSLRIHENQRFVTYDQDPVFRGNYQYAKKRHGAWWYGDGADSNLNGKYLQTPKRSSSSMYWGNFISLKGVKMMIRPKST